MTTTITIPALQTPVTHAWTGTVNNSASTESVGGAVKRRNLVINPSFGSGGVGGWTRSTNTFEVVTTPVHSGAYALKSTAAGANAAGASNVPLTAGLDYAASAWVNIPTNLSKPYLFRINFKNASGTALATVDSSTQMQTATDGWAQVYMSFTVPANATQADVFFMYANPSTAGEVFYIDDAMVELQSTYTGAYFDGSTPTSYLGFSTTPVLMTGWQESAESRNIINPILGGGVDVTLQAASKRSGSFTLLYADEDSAREAFEMHRLASIFDLDDDESGSIGMTYVVDGTLERALDEESRLLWTVTVPYREV